MVVLVSLLPLLALLPLDRERFSCKDTCRSFSSIPGTSTVQTRLSLVSETSMLGAQSPSASGSFPLSSARRSKRRSISFFKLIVPIHGISPRIMTLVPPCDVAMLQSELHRRCQH